LEENDVTQLIQDVRLDPNSKYINLNRTLVPDSILILKSSSILHRNLITFSIEMHSPYAYSP
jgi:hypothetical protein